MILAKEIASSFNIKIAKNFGKYLGFPILNNAPKASDYRFVIDKMRARLSTWKTNLLNIVGRTTLALATLNSIPNHAMQYTMLPTKIHKQIDQIQRNFIWGTITDRKKLHLIN